VQKTAAGMYAIYSLSNFPKELEDLNVIFISPS